jgi:predicted nucleic acid-binding protein
LTIACRNKRITSKQVKESQELLDELPIQIDTSTNLQFGKKLFDLATQYQITSYDAAYLELAIRLKLPLASFDKKLCIAAKKAGIFIL